jgi:sulfane dehydrogenase subunit SoxC
MSFKLEPRGFFRRIPLQPHQLTGRITPAADIIVLCHLGVPHVAADEWSLTVGGMVAEPKYFNLDALRRYPRVEVESVHECAGSPLQPETPTRRVSNVLWRGIRLGDLLDDCKIDADAAFVWAQGADYGEFQGVRVEAYVKDLPIGRIQDDVLIATEMNGAPLSRENGFPARLVIPGFYGTNSVKWLTGLTLAATRANSPFTTTWYNDLVRGPDRTVTGTVPVWAIAPHSLIVSPAPGEKLTAGLETDVWGWAWSDAGVASVAVTADGGASWVDANVEDRQGRGWQRFSAVYAPPSPGKYLLASCAMSHRGASQPRDGARNAWHAVEVEVL